MTKQQSIAKMLKLTKRLNEIVAELSARKEKMLAQVYHKAA
ncbi:hypothetical protein [Xenorhabdus cabanillasii]|nr:hypothetical protein [Xenorhabdus sp. Flor]